MNQQDFINTVAKYQPCTSRDLYLPLLGLGYYSNKTESEAIEDIAKHAGYLRGKGLLMSEKQTGSFGVRNVWSVKPETKSQPEETEFEQEEEMASDIAEITQPYRVRHGCVVTECIVWVGEPQNFAEVRREHDQLSVSGEILLESQAEITAFAAELSAILRMGLAS